jgi:acetyl-CoA synthetase
MLKFHETYEGVYQSFQENAPKVLSLRDGLPKLERIFVVRGEKGADYLDFWETLEKGSPQFQPVRTSADDPALIIYTSGTTGPPKGALHAHRVVLGHLPGVEFFHNFFPKKAIFTGPRLTGHG